MATRDRTKEMWKFTGRSPYPQAERGHANNVDYGSISKEVHKDARRWAAPLCIWLPVVFSPVAGQQFGWVGINITPPLTVSSFRSMGIVASVAASNIIGGNEALGEAFNGAGAKESTTLLTIVTIPQNWLAVKIAGRPVASLGEQRGKVLSTTREHIATSLPVNIAKRSYSRLVLAAVKGFVVCTTSEGLESMAAGVWVSASWGMSPARMAKKTPKKP